MTRLVPNLALLLAAILWGATFTLVKATVATLSPESFLFWRFLLAAVILVAMAAIARAFTRASIRYGLLLGVFLLAGFWLQTRGLVITTPSRSAFLTSVAVVLVPLCDFAIYRTRVPLAAVTAAILALAGIGIMVGDIGGGGFNAGDVLTLGCAVAFALHILVTARASRLASPLALVAIQVSVVAIAFAPWVAARPLEPLSRLALAGIAITAVATTVITFLLMTWAQARVSATDAAVMLAFEPVAAAMTSIGYYGERATLALLGGGAMIVVAMILAQRE